MEKGRGQGAGDGNVVRRAGRLVGRAASSSWLQKTLTGTIIAVITAAVLYLPAVLAYLVLYFKLRPDMVATVPVHLQYGVGPNPFGVAAVDRVLTRQPYDIYVSLTLPRSPANLNRGNFMIALHLLAPAPAPSGSRASSPARIGQALPYLTPASGPAPPPADPSSPDLPLQPTRLDLRAFLAAHEILHTTARPALIPYVDPIASLASRCLLVLYHMLFPRASSSVRLAVPMAEQLAFGRRHGGGGGGGGSGPSPPRPPQSLLLEVQAGQAIQVYEASVTFVPRLRGLTGFMYRWKAAAFALFTGGFWAVEMTLLALGLLVTGRSWMAAAPRSGDGSDEVDGEGLGTLEHGQWGVIEREGSVIVKNEEEDKEEEEVEGEKGEETGLLSVVPEFKREQGADAEDDETEGGEGEVSRRHTGREDFESENLGVGTSYSGPARRDSARRRKVPSWETSE